MINGFVVPRARSDGAFCRCGRDAGPAPQGVFAGESCPQSCGKLCGKVGAFSPNIVPSGVRHAASFERGIFKILRKSMGCAIFIMASIREFMGKIEIRLLPQGCGQPGGFFLRSY